MAEPTTPPPTPPLPSSLPVLPLRRVVAFPLTLQPLAVNRPASVESVNTALTTDRMLLLVLQKADSEEPDPDQLEAVGTICIVRQMARAEHGLNIIFEGVARVRVVTVTKTGTTIRAEVEPLPERVETGVETEAYERRIRELAERAVTLAAGASAEVRQLVLGIEDPLRLTYLLGSMLDASAGEKQAILAADPLLKKLELVHALLSREVSVLELKGKIESQAQAEMSESQRQYYLRQQLKAIQEQLGEGEASEVTELRERADQANLPELVRVTVMREIDRLARMSGSGSGEGQMIRTYLDWVLEVPWSVTTEDRIDPVAARTVLDEDHYDLDKVKERIVEYLAVRKLKGDMKGPILCFVGPPGVGKTSLGQSIAKAMQRKFVRISLGGVRDEAEIRGHRRTYIGAMPGRIVQALKQAGSANPVFMLDELDKLAVGFQGDPAAALLEVLDPAQNHSFRDHYLEIPVDLSKVLFIATANQLGTVHPALLDRMEIISLSGYTEEDKIHIARRYLIPRQLSEHGLSAAAVAIDDAALGIVISEHTREAGVRSLERLIGTIARKVAAKVVASGATESIAATTVDAAAVDDYLGPARFKKEVAFRTSAPGVATGLAWTEAGGDVLFIEASLLPGGSGQIILTGQLGSVMQESARAAVSHIRSQAEALGIDPAFLQQRDLHVHVPAGAIPKDGPSAGVTMATAILSAVTGRPVRADVAMTGEITLSGMVLPVGGIREKSLAARRMGIRTIILPALNEADLVDIPEELRRDMRFVFAKTLEDVLAVALTPAAPLAAPVAAHGPQDVDA
ncbi:MAG TPA: endopeptidase La [Vicinamibacterales bacterium]|nr:endopeptidase La [Vicinamibacterales bacterium]